MEVRFLGVTTNFSNNAIQVKGQKQIIDSLNCIGLSELVTTPTLPMLCDLNYIFALSFPVDVEFTPINISIILRKDGIDKASMSFNLTELLKSGDFKPKTKTIKTQIIHQKFNFTQIDSPGTYDVVCKVSEETIIGQIIFHPLPPRKYSLEEINAIKSNPLAIKYVRGEVSCNQCQEKLKFYTSFSKDKNLEKNGYIFAKEIPKNYSCKCGNMNFSTDYFRDGIDFFLGDSSVGREDLGIKALYQSRTLQGIANRFRNLLSTESSEEEFQEFIKKNPILLHMFNAREIRFKNPVLSKYKTDFTILTHSKRVINIEIEKPGLSMFTKTGHVAKDLKHAFDQLSDWETAISNNRGSYLEDLGYSNSEIVSIEFFVIAGRTGNHKLKSFHHLKNQYRNYGFMTYDDLLNSLIQLVSNVDKL